MKKFFFTKSLKIYIYIAITVSVTICYVFLQESICPNVACQVHLSPLSIVSTTVENYTPYLAALIDITDR